MAIHISDCYTVNSANTNGNIVMLPLDRSANVMYIKRGFKGANNSTSNATVEWSHSCAHSSWGYNTHTYTITMDNALRNAINSKINSGGLINIQNYINNIPELHALDVNGNNILQVYGYLCVGSSKSGSFDVNQYIRWDGSWPINYPATVTYNYDIPSIGHISDTIMLICNGWYTRSPSTTIAEYSNVIRNRYSDTQLMQPSDNWVSVSSGDSDGVSYTGPFTVGSGQLTSNGGDLAYFTINGIYSRNTGSRGIYADNGCDVLLNANSHMFQNIGITDLNNYLNSGTERIYSSNRPSITNNVIMSITRVDMQSNTITVKFAMKHNTPNSVVMFRDSRSFISLRIDYNFPITSINRINDTWSIRFSNDDSFNPTNANGSGPSALIWDSANTAVVLTAGSAVNNDHGMSKIISRSPGVLQCSCSNVNNVTRVNVGGYSITIPNNISTINIKILSTNNGNLGFWTITKPGLGYSHSFNINYPATEDAPLTTFNNELYTAITQAFNEPSIPFLFEIMSITDQFSLNVSGLVRCDKTDKDGKTYYAVSVYDVNGDFSQLLVKNGMVVTMPVTLTVDISIVNNTILVKAGMSSIGLTNTTIGDLPINADSVAVLLPSVASVSKSGARIGYATTTVNQSSFAFSFSALKEEVEQTDDFVSHYLQ